LPVSDYFSYSYFYTVKDIKGKWLFNSWFFGRSTLIASLMMQREIIIRELDAAKIEYNNYLEAAALN
jgi:hypothetical protein